MKCPRCGAENRDGSNFCRYCALSLNPTSEPTSGYIPSVPPPGEESFRGPNSPPRADAPPRPPQAGYAPPPPLPAAPLFGQLICPRCHAISVTRGTTPVWAILLAVILALPTCFLSLFFLMIKDPNHCVNCGLEFR
jgi:ribosomal protein L40E